MQTSYRKPQKAGSWKGSALLEALETGRTCAIPHSSHPSLTLSPTQADGSERASLPPVQALLDPWKWVVSTTVIDKVSD